MKRRDFIFTSTATLLFTGCSASSDNIGNPERSSTSNAAVSKLTGAGSVRLGFSAWPGWIPWQVANDQGIVNDVEFKWFENYTESISALNEGKIDCNSQTLGDTIIAVANGADLVIVLTNDYSTGNDKIIVDNSIKSVQDLRGKIVAVEEATVDHFLLLQVLQSAGLTAVDVTILPLETSQAVRAFTAGKADAVGCFAPFTTAALKRPKSRELFSSKDYPGSISDHLVFSRSFVDQNPERVQKIVNAWFKTLDAVKKDSAGTIKIMAKRANTTTAEYQEYANGTRIFSHADNLKAFQAGETMDHLNHAAQMTAKFLKEGNMIIKEPDLSKLFDDRFVKAYSVKN